MTNFDFLRLMWEAQPSAIVMLCQLKEEGKERKGGGEEGRRGRREGEELGGAREDVKERKVGGEWGLEGRWEGGRRRANGRGGWLRTEW